MPGPPGATQPPQGLRAGPRQGVRLSRCPWATLPRQGAAGSSAPPHPPRTQQLRWRVAAQGKAWGSPNLRPCCRAALCSPANPVEIALGKLLSRTPRLPAPPCPGTIPLPGVSPAGRGGGSCATVCSASLLLVARAIIKGLVGPSLLQGFGTLLPPIWGRSWVSLHKTQPCGHLSSTPMGS